MRRGTRRPWVQLRTLERAQVLLILPCNAAACVGNYFRAEVYRKSGWNTWREADFLLRDLRTEGRVALAAVDSSILETAPDDPRGAIVLETEMHRAKSPDGEDWGTPAWRRFRPTKAGRWTALENLTEALVHGVQRVEGFGFTQVFALANPRAYFLALAAAVAECSLLERWVLFRSPAHPRHLRHAVQEIVPFVRTAAAGADLPGGVYPIPALFPILRREWVRYRAPIPPPWRPWAHVTVRQTIRSRWTTLQQAADVRRWGSGT